MPVRAEGLYNVFLVAKDQGKSSKVKLSVFFIH